MLENYRPSMELVKLIGEIDEFKGAWKSLSSISPERLASLKKVATIESIGSSTRIEGASLSNEEVDRILSGLNTQSFHSRDEQEVAGYSSLMQTIYENWKSIPLTENHVKQLHRTLLQFTHKDDRHRGNYKTVENSVEARDEDGRRIGVIFQTASPFETPFMMTELFYWLETVTQKSEIHPLLIIGAFVVRFLAIHPFQDGNGRLSRCLTTLLLLKAGYLYVPYSSLEGVIEANKEQYYLALRQTQVTLRSDEPNWEPWLSFFLRSLKRQLQKLTEKIERAQILQGELPALSIRIMELVREQGSVKSTELITLTGEKRSTVLLRLKELVQDGHLKRNGKGPATWYTLPR
ncbi:MAG: Fic family protein [Candidatus Competibacteraceae bacterium]|nr:Fic family protein [Candidatus Competibacteraceae bacterium]